MTLLIEYIQLCWFKNNPYDLHPSRAFLWRCVVFYVVSGIIVEANISDPADATLEVAMRTIVALSLLSLQVLSTKQGAVFYQLQSAVFVCENVIVTLGIGVEVLDVFVQGTEYEDLPLYLGGVLLIWYLAIIIYIFKKVFSYHLGNCIALAIFYFLATYGAPFLLMEVL